LPRKNHRRSNIPGMSDAWQISTAGIVYHHRKAQPPTRTRLPAVDLLGEYRGPLLPPGCAPDCPRCNPTWRRLPAARPGCYCILCTEDGPPPQHVPSTERLVAELVCHTFHGPPPDGILASTVRHIDGDTGHCHADNVCWALDETRDKWQERQQQRRLMRPGFLAPYVVRDSRTHQRAARLYTNSNNLPVTPLPMKETA
jgi:hypothetical protein